MEGLREMLLQEENRLERILQRTREQLKMFQEEHCVCPTAENGFNIIIVYLGKGKMGNIFLRPIRN